MSDTHDRLRHALADRYRIERKLGEGGMATVFLAEDLKHQREVAIKVLRPELAAVVGGDRFLAEIQTTATLRHPHILPLFDSGEADGFLFYVMPYVEGETLQERLGRERQLTVEEAVRIAVAVANALHHAHERGVVHRDIKPANILLQDGEPIVADFGIALAVGAAGGNRLTETGLSVGTPYYMSPEQATGDQSVGPASDVYALGCVLYELLIGDPPHVGSTAQAVLGKIIAGERVQPAKNRPSIPPHVDAAVRKALERLPADRFTDASAFARALKNPAFRWGAEDVPTAGSAGAWRGIAIAASLAAVASVAALAWIAGSRSDDVRDIGLPHEAPMQFGDAIRSLAVAPDGSFIVYTARAGSTTQLWYRSLDGTDARPIRGTEGAAAAPAISPDGSRVAFVADQQLHVVDVEGTSVSVIGDASLPTGVQWLDDGSVFFSEDDGRVLAWINPETGLVRREMVSYCAYPNLLDDTSTVLCSGGSWKFAFNRSIPDDGTVRTWTRAASTGQEGQTIRGADFRVVDGGYLVYLSIDGSLMAAPIIDRDARTAGRSTALVSDVRREAYSGVGQFDLARDGTLVYASGDNAESGFLVRVSQDGETERLNVDEALHLRFSESPDGRRFATVVEAVEDQELRIYDLVTGTYETVEEGFWISGVAWSPDGSEVAYTRASEDDFFTGAGLYVRRLNSPDEPRLLLRDTITYAHFHPADFIAPDSLLVGVGDAGTAALLLDPTTDPVEVDSLDIDPFFLSLSPDRRWLAWQPQGGPSVQVQPWPELNRQYLVSAVAGEPRWLSDGQLIYYETADPESQSEGWPFYRLRMDPSAANPVGEPVEMVRDRRFSDTPGWSHTPSSDGRLIYLRGPEVFLGHYVRVVPGWVHEMKRAVAEANR